MRSYSPVLLLCCFLACDVAAARLAAAQQVRAVANDGRVLSGELDSRTDQQALWIRQSASSVVLAIALDWEQLAEATLDGQNATRSELQEQAAATPSAPSPVTVVEPLVPIVPQAPLPQRPPRLRSVEIVDACLANFDRNVEPDGLLLTIAPLDEQRRAIAVRGSLAVRLFGQRRANTQPAATFGDLEHWTLPVRPGDFVDGLATYELRFRGTAPEWEFDLLPDALLSVELGAFGHGNFAAAAPVTIRAFNPFRDNLQQNRGSRFAPEELRGRRPTSDFHNRDGLWIHWTW